MRGKRYVYMDATAGAAGGGAAAGDAGAGAAAAGATDAAAAGAADAGAAASGAQGGAAASGGSAAPGSALAAGSAGAGEGDAAGSNAALPFAERVPEKFRVKKEDGTIDIEATAAKVEEHRASLEKRLGTGDIRPKTAAEYKLPDLPEALKGMSVDDESTAKFREDAHKMGLSQAQFEGVMARYYEMAPLLVNAGMQHSAETTVGELKKAWGENYDANAKNAWRGVTQIAKVAGLTVDQVENELGNSPAFNRIMAAVGAQLREDTSVNTGGSGVGSVADMAEAGRLQASEAFRNPSHPEHKLTVEKWNKILTNGVPDTPVV